MFYNGQRKWPGERNETFRQKLNEFYNTSNDYEESHMRSIAHGINIDVKDCLKLAHDVIGTIRWLVFAVKYSVRRRELFKKLTIGLHEQEVVIPSCEFETRWCSTFKMIRLAAKAKRISRPWLNAFLNWAKVFFASSEEWDKEIRTRNFL